MDILGESGQLGQPDRARRRASATGTLVLEAQKVHNHGFSLLPLQWPLHDVPNRVLGGLARVQNGVYLLGNRHFDLMFAGQRQQRLGGVHALGHHAHIREDFAQSSPFAQLDSDKAIAAERARASEHQIAQPRQSAERFRPRSQRHGQTRHFRQAARNQRRESIRTKTQPLARAGGNGHHVFHRAGKLHAQDVVVGIETEVWASKFFLYIGGERGIPRGYNDGGGFAASGFRRERWSGNHRDARRKFRR